MNEMQLVQLEKREILNRFLLFEMIIKYLDSSDD